MENTNTGADGAKAPSAPTEAELKAQKELADAKKVIADLKAKLKENAPKKERLAKLGEDEYRAVGKGVFTLEGKKYTPDEIYDNEELLAKLVEIGSGLVEKVVK